MDEPGQVGRFQVVGRLGQGGMGTVYLGEDESGQRVAIKVINPAMAHDQAFRERFRREAEAATKVRRFCTAGVIETALDDDLLYIVSEYVPGPTLDQVVRSEGPLRGSSLEALAVGVATALTAIHAAGLVHRDLKPSNVLLSSMGPRVIDFGIARALGTHGLTGTGELVGTPQYMAPEVLRGESATPACDVFSWGCLVTFAATGRPPFSGNTLPEVVYQVLNADPKLDDLDPALRTLVATALAKDPAARPAVSDLLHGLVGGEAADTGRPTATPPHPQTSPRRVRPRLLIAAGAASVAIAVVAAVLVPRLGSGAPEGRPVFDDDFSIRTGWDGYQFDPANGVTRGTEIARGVYTMQSTAQYPENVSPAPFPSPPDDVVIAVTATAKPNTRGQGELGLICRDDSNVPRRYLLLVSVDGTAWISRIDGGSVVRLGRAERTATITLGTPARLVAECRKTGQGVRLALWVDGERLIETVDAQGLPNGAAGLATRVSESSDSVMEVAFDDFTVGT
ncbi:serine/threonine-protein kinase [Nonomuraea sp. NPDC048916]|uniref:serine/threonine-protein kinase n=1 Tax=Nonomuraea sp. NPDC048916 TaxID=3154232 RepID=UPI0033E880AB